MQMASPNLAVQPSEDLDVYACAGAPAVLIVDDDIFVADELAETLNFHGYECFIAHSVCEAIQTCMKTPRIGTVITDFYLSGGGVRAANGVELLSTLRDVMPERSFQSVVISGDANVATTCSVLKGISFLPKPHETLLRP